MSSTLADAFAALPEIWAEAVYLDKGTPPPKPWALKHVQHLKLRKDGRTVLVRISCDDPGELSGPASRIGVTTSDAPPPNG